MPERDRDEHLAWCKERAREYLKRGDARNAITSMSSDLAKHSEWKNSKIMPMLMLSAAMTGTVESARRYVEGWN